MFHIDGVYVLGVVGRGSCTLKGFPTLSVYRDTTSNSERRARVSVHVMPDGAAAGVSLRGRERAGFVINYLADPSVGRCRTSHFVLRLPDVPQRITLGDSDSFNVCPGPYEWSRELRVSPIEPLSDLPHPSPKRAA